MDFLDYVVYATYLLLRLPSDGPIFVVELSRHHGCLGVLGCSDDPKSQSGSLERVA